MLMQFRSISRLGSLAPGVYPSGLVLRYQNLFIASPPVVLNYVYTIKKQPRRVSVVYFIKMPGHVWETLSVC